MTISPHTRAGDSTRTSLPLRPYRQHRRCRHAPHRARLLLATASVLRTAPVMDPLADLHDDPDDTSGAPGTTTCTATCRQNRCER